MFSKLSDKIFVPALVLAGLALAGAANAEPAEVTKVVVRYADLDLSTSKGTAELDRRIAHAAHRICDVSGVRSLTERDRAEVCRVKVIGDSAAQESAAVAAAQTGTKYAMASTGIALGR